MLCQHAWSLKGAPEITEPKALRAAPITQPTIHLKLCWPRKPAGWESKPHCSKTEHRSIITQQLPVTLLQVGKRISALP